jgi:dihydroxyacetone kinase
MTSLNASGFSASLLNVSSVNRHLASQGINTAINTYELLDAPTEAYSWLGVKRYSGEGSSLQQEDTKDYFAEIASEEVEESKVAGLGTTTTLAPIADALRSACHSVLKVEKELTEADTVLGDGDCGHTFAAGALGMFDSWKHYDLTNVDEIS